MTDDYYRRLRKLNCIQFTAFMLMALIVNTIMLVKAS
jgi:hypothetical protein